MKKKLQIFVSSTFEDLKFERQLVMEAILELGHIPAGMEYFVSDDYDQFEIIKKWIQEADAYILISGGRYGSIDKRDSAGRSFTHLEYDYAHDLKKPIGILRLTSKYINEKKSNGIYSDNDVNDPKLLDFRNNLKLCNNVSSEYEVKSEAKTLIDNFSHKLLKKNNGWIRLENVSNLLNLYQRDLDLANRKLLSGNYHMYYYSFGHTRYVHSTISFYRKANDLSFTLKNDIIKDKPTYIYKGQFDVYDDFIYLEGKSITDNEKIFLIIKLLPGKLRNSTGIVIGQGTAKQAVATSFLISKTRIDDIQLLDKFQASQSTIKITEAQILNLIN